MNINLQNPIPVRFSPASKRRILSTARRFGLKPSQIIRQAVELKLPEWERGSMIISPRTEMEAA